MPVVLGTILGTSISIPIIVDEDGALYVAQHVEDTPFLVGDKGMLTLAVRNDAGGPLVNASGDKTPLQTDAQGRLVVTGGPGGVMAVVQAIHDLLNCNANIQVGDIDVSNLNPVPVSDAGGSLTVDQALHDLLNANANVQVGDVDVSQANPVPSRGNAATPAVYNVNMVLANTEYSQALPNNTQRFCLQCHTEFDIRFAFASGFVAVPAPPYGIVRGGMNYYEDQCFLTGVTLYVACGTAGQVAEIVCWT